MAEDHELHDEGGQECVEGGGDRKAFAVFIRRKLGHITTLLDVKLNTSEKGEIIEGFNRAAEAWPRWLIESLAEKCRAELKLPDPARATRGKL